MEYDLPAGRADQVRSVDAPAPDGDAGLAADDIDMALDAIEQELADVELALERLGDGTYGRCETCGGSLTPEELESLPAGRFCRAHLPLEPR